MIHHEEEYPYYSYETRSGGRNFGSLFTGFLIGGLVGVIAAFLMAPQSGEETRAQIKDKSEELKDKAKTTIEDARSQIMNKSAEIKEKATETVGETRARTEQALTDARARAGETIQHLGSRAEEMGRTARERGEEIAHKSDSEMGM
jgi:gas vesicle protein